MTFLGSNCRTFENECRRMALGGHKTKPLPLLDLHPFNSSRVPSEEIKLKTRLITLCCVVLWVEDGNLGYLHLKFYFCLCPVIKLSTNWEIRRKDLLGFLLECIFLASFSITRRFVHPSFVQIARINFDNSRINNDLLSLFLRHRPEFFFFSLLYWPFNIFTRVSPTASLC